jgi:hypothetical protein
MFLLFHSIIMYTNWNHCLGFNLMLIFLGQQNSYEIWEQSNLTCFSSCSPLGFSRSLTVFKNLF